MADYNINAVTRRVVYTGSAGLGPYAFSFEILDQNDIAVYFNTTKLTLTTDYTVTINANGTGSITIVTGSGVPSTPTASDTITIVGARDIERTTDFVTAGDLRAAALNEQLDGLTIFDQQLAEENKRTLKAPVTDPAHVDEGGTLDMTLPSKTARAGKYLQFNSTTGNPEAGPDSTDVTTLADIATDIATLADIEDGTDATDAIQTVAGISANVSTVAGIASNVSTVAGIQSDVTSVAADATDIGTVATNIASVNTVAGNITEVIAVANDLNEAVSEVETVANDLNEAVSEIETVAASITNVDTVGTNISNVNTVAGIDSNVTTVAGISGNVTTVAGISGNVTTVAGISADVTTVAADGTDIGTVATNISNVNTVAGISSNVTTVAGNNANVTTVASNIADVNTVAGSIADVNTFAVRYRIASSAPATSLDEGDLYFDTTDNQMYVYTGSAWVAVSPDLVADTTPQLGGNLDTNGNDITFGDGDTAFFGDSNDLKIFHAADNSYIQDVGTGNLNLTTNGAAVNINGAGGQSMIVASSGGAVTLYHNNNPKAATTSGGIDVTGTVTADGLTVDVSSGSAQIIDSGTTATDTPQLLLGNGDASGRSGIIRNYNDASNFEIIASASITGAGKNLVIRTEDSSAIRQKIASNGDVSLYDSTGVTQGFFWDASTQRLGLGSTNPQQVLHGNSASNSVYFYAQTTSASREAGIQLGNTASTGTYIYKSANTDDLNFYLNASNRMTITSGGNVGIGTASPGGELHLYRNSTGPCRLLLQNTEDLSYIYSDGGQLIFDSDNGHLFRNEAGTTEFGRFDSSGNLLVGKTSTSFTTAGTRIAPSGQIEAVVDDAGVLTLKRQVGTGNLVGFYYNTSVVGSIETNGSSTTYNTTSDIRLKQGIEPIADGTDKLMAMNPVSYNWRADPDGPRSMGFIAQEMKDVMPEAVSVGDDDDAMMSMDYGRITPILVAALQEALTKIDNLESRLAALEAN